jgi:hypothetical protein
MRQLLMMAHALLLLAGCATHVASSSAVVLQDDSRPAHEGFSERDRRLILDYYQHHKRGQQEAPTGLVRRDVLPPTLPSRQLPAALEAQLTPLPAGYTRLEVGNDVMLINRNSRVILDIVYGVGA